MNAIEVIRIGRSRSSAASIAASAMDRPCFRSCSANSTIRMAFLAASPISNSRPICTYTSFEYPRNETSSSAPRTAIGTESKMTNGNAKLSYRAASVRYTTMIPRLKMIIALPCDSTSSSANPLQVKDMPCNLFCAKSSCMAFRPWSELYPGAAEPSISAERNRLKWLITCGPAVLLMYTRLSSGTMPPLLERIRDLANRHAHSLGLLAVDLEQQLRIIRRITAVQIGQVLTLSACPDNLLRD